MTKFIRNNLDTCPLASSSAIINRYVIWLVQINLQINIYV